MLECCFGFQWIALYGLKCALNFDICYGSETVITGLKFITTRLTDGQKIRISMSTSNKSATKPSSNCFIRFWYAENKFKRILHCLSVICYVVCTAHNLAGAENEIIRSSLVDSLAFTCKRKYLATNTSSCISVDAVREYPSAKQIYPWGKSARKAFHDGFFGIENNVESNSIFTNNSILTQTIGL